MMHNVMTSLGILLLSGIMAVQVYAGWGSHGAMKGSGRMRNWVPEHVHAYNKLNSKERTDPEKLSPNLKEERLRIVSQTEIEGAKPSLPSTVTSKEVKGILQEEGAQSAQVQDEDQNLKFNLNKSASENYFSASCGTAHPAVTGGSCHM
jgi:hypothetical protein